LGVLNPNTEYHLVEQYCYPQQFGAQYVESACNGPTVTVTEKLRQETQDY